MTRINASRNADALIATDEPVGSKISKVVKDKARIITACALRAWPLPDPRDRRKKRMRSAFERLVLSGDRHT